MSGKTIAAAIVVAAAVGTGTFLLVNKKKTVTTSSITVTLTGPSTAGVDTSTPYSIFVMNGSNPVTSASVSLKNSSGTVLATGMTDSSGTATLSVKFPSSGTYTIYGEYSGVKSSSITVTASSSPPPSGCTSCSDCPPGYNCVNGNCVELIPASIQTPPTVYAPTMYFQYTRMDNNVIDITYALLPMPSEANQCLSSPINSPINATSVLSINGKVTDAAGHGVNGITVDFGIVGGGSWTAGNVGSNSFSGTTSLSMKEPSAVTDCNGNFTAEILIHIVLGYSQGFFAGFDTPFFPIPTPSGTLTVSSGNLARAITIISFNDFISAYNCIYVGGVLA